MSADLNSLQAPNDDKQFEQLCLHVLEHLHKTLRGQAYGRNGQAQYGVDFYIEVPASDGTGCSVITQFIGVQCKHKDRLLEGELGVKELEDEVKKAKGFKPALTTFIIATSAPTDTKPQDKARELTAEHQRQNPQLFSVEVWFWEKIRDEFSKNRELRREVLDRFYPHLALAHSTQHSVLHQLPMKPAHFMGRDEELAELENEIASAHPAGATISGVRTKLHGAPGVGKTALATILAHQLKDHYPDAQLYLNLRGAGADIHGQHSPVVKPMTSAEAMQSVIHAFHPEEKLPEELDKLSVKYNGVLNDAGRVMLFFDNAADAAQVQPLLPPDNCLLLVTSRAQFSLPGLAGRNIDCLRPEMSQRLLRDLAPRIEGFENEAAGLCGHLPLALKVFAGVVNNKKLFPVPELLKRLREGLMKLASLDAAFQVSYELLAKYFRQHWTLLAVFPANFDLQAAAAIWKVKEDSAREIMQFLMNNSLVEGNEANGRFRLHDLVREFCDGKLSDYKRSSAKLLYVGYFRDVGIKTDAFYLKGGDQMLAGLKLFDQERIHIEAAFNWLQPRHDYDSALMLMSLVNAVVHASILRFDIRQRIRWLESQHKAAQITKDHQSEASSLANLGIAYADFGDEQKTLELNEQALIIVRRLGDRRGEANILGNLATSNYIMGKVPAAIDIYKQCLKLHCEIGDQLGQGKDLQGLGIAYMQGREKDKAIGSLKQALAIFRAIGAKREQGGVLSNLGVAYKLLGDTYKAVEYHEMDLVLAREIGDQRGESGALGNLGNIFLNLGELNIAVELCDQALAIDRVVGDRRGEANNLWNSALALNKQGHQTQAISRAEVALQIFKAIEDTNATKVHAKLAEWRGQA